jgi:hypothetical protein
MTTTPVAYSTLPPFAVNTTDGDFAQRDGEIVGLIDGGFVIFWNDSSHAFGSSGTIVVGQRFDALGNKVGGEVKISQFFNGDDTLSVGNGSAITRLANGNLAIVYTDLFSGDNDTLVRVVNPATLGPVRNDQIDADDLLQTKNPAITSFADNSYVVSYTLDNGSGNTDILARIVSPTGTVGAPITVRDDGTLSADFSQLATLSNNNFVVVYQQQIAADHDISFAIYTATGSSILSNQGVPGSNVFADDTDPDVAALANGGFVVAWTGADASGGGIRATIFDNAGTASPAASFIQVNTSTSGNQNEASIVALKDGGFVVTWEDDSASTVRGQRFDAIGHKIGSEFLVKSNAAFGSPPDSHDSALLSDGRFVYAMGSLDSNGNDSDVTASIWDPRSRVSDFNSDAHSDLLWQNDNGQAAIWLMEGPTPIIQSGVGGNPGPTWHEKAAADFNGDGNADILWQNDNGQAAIWLMSGISIAAEGLAGANPGASWHVVDAGDFNADGKADILWQNDNGQVAIWLMNGGTPIFQSAVGVNLGPTWHVKAAADFNGDAVADILWQNDNGQAATWLMSGVNVAAEGLAGVNPGPTWHVKDAGDFNADGKADILWQNDNGQAAIWLMNGGTPIAQSAVGANPGPSWHAKAAAYFDDPMADIVWQNDNGQVAIWLINGLTPVQELGVGSNPGADWHVF